MPGRPEQIPVPMCGSAEVSSIIHLTLPSVSALIERLCNYVQRLCWLRLAFLFWREGVLLYVLQGEDSWGSFSDYLGNGFSRNDGQV